MVEFSFFEGRGYVLRCGDFRASPKYAVRHASRGEAYSKLRDWQETMTKSKKKPRSEWIYGTTVDEVTEIGLEISSDGSSAKFSQKMNDAYVQTTYPRVNKEPKVVTRIPVGDLEIPFVPNKAIEKFDNLVAVDTGTRTIQGVNVSVTGIVEGEWNWEGGVNGLARKVRPKAPFCVEFRGAEKEQEQLGWLIALEELSKEARYQQSKGIGLIVDSQLGNHEAYNSRQLPLCMGRYLPEKVTLLYASDQGRENMSNFLHSLAHSITEQVFQKILEGNLPWNSNQGIVGTPILLRKIVVRGA